MEDKENVQILPIDPEILVKRSMISALIAKLSYRDEKAALHYLRIWGEKRMPITQLYLELEEAIEEFEEKQ